jgi:hypothetical protein
MQVINLAYRLENHQVKKYFLGFDNAILEPIFLIYQDILNELPIQYQGLSPPCFYYSF